MQSCTCAAYDNAPLTACQLMVSKRYVPILLILQLWMTNVILKGAERNKKVSFPKKIKSGIFPFRRQSHFIGTLRNLVPSAGEPMTASLAEVELLETGNGPVWMVWRAYKVGTFSILVIIIQNAWVIPIFAITGCRWVSGYVTSVSTGVLYIRRPWLDEKKALSADEIKSCSRFFIRIFIS